VLEELEIMLPKASDSESGDESEPDSGENISDNEGEGKQGGETGGKPAKKKAIAGKGKKGAQGAGLS
jgi:hypothetical protein